MLIPSADAKYRKSAAAEKYHKCPIRKRKQLNGVLGVVRKRKTYFDEGANFSIEENQVSLPVSAESTGFQPLRPKKHKSGKRKDARLRQAADANAIAGEAQILAELRSGVASILSGLEPENVSTSTLSSTASTTRPCEGRLPKDIPRGSNEKAGDNQAITKKGCDATTTDPVARFSATNKRARIKKTKKGRKNDPRLPDAQHKSSSRMGSDKPDITVCPVAASSKAEVEVEPLFSSKRKKRLRHKYTAKKDQVGNPPAHVSQDGEVPESKKVALVPNNLPDTKQANSKRERLLLLPSSQDVREKALERLRAAQFRLLNEELYTSESTDAVRSFGKDPGAFHVYHEGFEHQVSKWPVNPVDVIIESLRSMPRSTVIADLGCGEAKIAQTLAKHKVHSFDLIALNDHVTVSDMSRLPLYRNTVDVVVFCLSLMGTNLNAFILEANRILKKEGILKIAEVKSRFKNFGGFAKTMTKFGFQLIHQDESNKMFVLFDFKKLRSTTRHPYLPKLKLMPCLYKRR